MKRKNGMKNKLLLTLSSALLIFNSFLMFASLVTNEYFVAAISAIFIYTNFVCIRAYSNEVIADAKKGHKN